MDQVEPDIRHGGADFHRMEENNVIHPITGHKNKEHINTTNRQETHVHLGYTLSLLVQQGDPDTSLVVSNPATTHTRYTRASKTNHMTVTCSSCDLKGHTHLLLGDDPETCSRSGWPRVSNFPVCLPSGSLPCLHPGLGRELH